jgi:hypothetical protein
LDSRTVRCLREDRYGAPTLPGGPAARGEAAFSPASRPRAGPGARADVDDHPHDALISSDRRSGHRGEAASSSSSSRGFALLPPQPPPLEDRRRSSGRVRSSSSGRRAVAPSWPRSGGGPRRRPGAPGPIRAAASPPTTGRRRSLLPPAGLKAPAARQQQQQHARSGRTRRRSRLMSRRRQPSARGGSSSSRSRDDDASPASVAQRGLPWMVRSLFLAAACCLRERSCLLRPGASWTSGWKARARAGAGEEGCVWQRQKRKKIDRSFAQLQHNGPH